MGVFNAVSLQCILHNKQDYVEKDFQLMVTYVFVCMGIYVYAGSVVIQIIVRTVRGFFSNQKVSQKIVP